MSDVILVITLEESGVRTLRTPKMEEAQNRWVWSSSGTVFSCLIRTTDIDPSTHRWSSPEEQCRTRESDVRTNPWTGCPPPWMYLCSSAKREFSFRHNRVCIRALLFEWFLCSMSEHCEWYSCDIIETWKCENNWNSRASRSNTTYAASEDDVWFWTECHEDYHMPSRSIPTPLSDLKSTSCSIRTSLSISRVPRSRVSCRVCRKAEETESERTFCSRANVLW